MTKGATETGSPVCVLGGIVRLGVVAQKIIRLIAALHFAAVLHYGNSSIAVSN